MVRVKRRYIVLNVKSAKGSASQDAIVKELRDKVQQVYGDFGVACLNRGFSVKRYDPKAGYLILCVRKGVHELVMSVAPIISEYRVNIFHLSGTLRGCLKKLKKEYIMNIRRSIAESTSSGTMAKQLVEEP